MGKRTAGSFWRSHIEPDTPVRQTDPDNCPEPCPGFQPIMKEI